MSPLNFEQGPVQDKILKSSRSSLADFMFYALTDVYQ